MRGSMLIVQGGSSQRTWIFRPSINSRYNPGTEPLWRRHCLYRVFQHSDHQRPQRRYYPHRAWGRVDDDITVLSEQYYWSGADPVCRGRVRGVCFRDNRRCV